MAATRLAGWEVGTAEDGVVTVYVPDERPELAVQIRYALEVDAGRA
jgi:hypothetical protein